MAADDPNPPIPPALREEVKAAFDRARDARTPGPGSDPERLRQAYLGLLKLALCDLAAPRTMSVERTSHGVASHEIRDGWLKMRSLGMDWPRYGLTMVGLTRLDDLQGCVESVVGDRVPGDVIEAGTWRGGASMLMRATLDTLGDPRSVWVADSFQGFRDDLESEDLAGVDFLAVSLEEVKDNFARFGLEEGVEYVPGYFEDTMPQLGDREWAIARLDGDSYGATRLTLDTLYPQLSVGGFLVVDDYYVLEECRAAVDEFRAEHGITEPLEQVDWTCTRWRRESDARIEPTAGVTSPRRGERPGPGPVRRPGYTPVPTAEELTLRRETAALRARVEAAEGALASRRWLRRG